MHRSFQIITHRRILQLGSKVSTLIDEERRFLDLLILIESVISLNSVARVDDLAVEVLHPVKRCHFLERFSE